MSPPYDSVESPNVVRQVCSMFHAAAPWGRLQLSFDDTITAVLSHLTLTRRTCMPTRSSSYYRRPIYIHSSHGWSRPRHVPVCRRPSCAGRSMAIVIPIQAIGLLLSLELLGLRIAREEDTIVGKGRKGTNPYFRQGWFSRLICRPLRSARLQLWFYLLYSSWLTFIRTTAGLVVVRAAAPLPWYTTFLPHRIMRRFVSHSLPKADAPYTLHFLGNALALHFFTAILVVTIFCFPRRRLLSILRTD